MSAFLNPHLLWGLLLLAAPVIIHLLNKRRFETHRWAAMEFLLQADVRNRRRVQVEDLLLLLLRAALVAAAVFLVARPVVEGFGGSDEGARTLIVDDSFSMEQRQGGQSSLERARGRAANEVQQAIARGARISVRRGTRPAEEIGKVEVPVRGGEVLEPQPSSPDGTAAQGAAGPAAGLESGLALLSALRALPAADGALRFAEALEIEAKEIEAAHNGESRAVYLVSDFRRADWLEPSGELKPRLREAFARLARVGRDRVRLRFLNVGEPGRENCAVIRLGAEAAQPISGVPVSISVEVKNFGAEERRGLGGELEVGDPANPSHRIPLPSLPPLPPGGSASVVVDHTFPAAGEYPLSVRLDEDSLTRDDRAFAVALAREALSVLVVDGDPAADRLKGEAGFLAAALAPRGGLPTGIRPEVVTDLPGPESLKGRDVVFLLNCPSLTPDARQALDSFAAAGGGLAFFLGSRVDAASYRDLLGDAGIFPATLQAPVESRGGVRMDFGDLSHSAFKVYEGLRDASLERITAARYFGLAAGKEARVVAAYSDAERTPALIERAHGRGRTSLFNISADRDWTDWPTDPSYPVVLQEWVRYLAPRRGEARTLPVGQALSFGIAPGSEPSVTDPRGERAAVVLSGGQARVERLVFAGFYRVEGVGGAGTGSAPGISQGAGQWFAVNRPVEESDLTPATEGELRSALAGIGLPYAFSESGREEGADQREGDIWRWLALSAGLLLLGELAMAWWFGRR